MSFSAALQRCFQKAFCFHGRAMRSEYWFFYLFVSVLNLLFANLIRLMPVLQIPLNLLTLLLLIPAAAVAWRRMHDIGKPGFYNLVVLIPFGGPILELLWMATDSQPSTNKYGPCEKVFDPNKM